MDDQGAAGPGNDGAPRRRVELGLAEGAADVEGRRRHAGCFEGVISEAGAFADAARG